MATEKRQYFKYSVSDTGSVSFYYKPTQDGDYEEEPRLVLDPADLPAVSQTYLAGAGIVKKVTADTSDVSVEDVGPDGKIAAIKEVWERLLSGELKKPTVRGPSITADHYKAFAAWQGISVEEAMALFDAAPVADRKVVLEHPVFIEHLAKVKADKPTTAAGGSLLDMLG